MKKSSLKFNVFLTVLLLLGIAFSVITMANAVTPNPGHDWSEVGSGLFSVIGPTTPHTFTFPDSNATVATLENPNTFTATQTINNPSAAQLVLTSTSSSVFGQIYADAAGDLQLSSSGGSGIYTGIQNIRINEGNLWACAGGACGTAVTTTHPVVTNGNIIVENALILDNNFQFKQTGATTVDMLDSGGNTILELDEGQ